MARANRRRLFRLPRRADQQPCAERVSIPRPRSLASAAMSAQPKSKNAMDAHDETGRRVPPPAASPASLAKCPLLRQTPEVGAECPNWARSDLCGGRSAMGVPTANWLLRRPCQSVDGGSVLTFATLLHGSSAADGMRQADGLPMPTTIQDGP